MVTNEYAENIGFVKFSIHKKQLRQLKVKYVPGEQLLKAQRCIVLNRRSTNFG